MSGNGSVFRRGEVWWCSYYFRGKRTRESSGSTLKKNAKALLRKRLAEMGSGRLIGPEAERVTFADLEELAICDYKVNKRKSLSRLELALDHLREHFDRWRALDITTHHIKRYIVHRQQDGAANATIRQELAALKRAFNLAIEGEHLSTAPKVPALAVSNTRVGFLSHSEVSAVVEELSPALGAVVRFAFLTGWRKQEVLTLLWTQVSWETGVIHLAAKSTKNDQARELPFRALPQLEELLKAQLERTRGAEKKLQRIVPLVFHRNGRAIRDMRGAWDGACERAGLAGSIWFHDLRRSAVRNMERAGVSRSVAMRMTGHKTESMYTRYAIVDSRAMEEGARKLGAFIEGDRGEDRKVIPMSNAQ